MHSICLDLLMGETFLQGNGKDVNYPMSTCSAVSIEFVL